MMKIAAHIIVCATVVLALMGCASGPKFAEASAKFAPLSTGQGRIYFYRDGSPFGSAVQPGIYVGSDLVGKSQPGGFFYIDRPAGNYIVSCSTEAEHKLSIALASDETRYVRTQLSMGLFVGQVAPLLEDKDAAMKTLSSCSYMGPQK